LSEESDLLLVRADEKLISFGLNID